jgi:hypothetical protein
MTQLTNMLKEAGANVAALEYVKRLVPRVSCTSAHDADTTYLSRQCEGGDAHDHVGFGSRAADAAVGRRMDEGFRCPR